MHHWMLEILDIFDLTYFLREFQLFFFSKRCADTKHELQSMKDVGAGGSSLEHNETVP